MDLRKLFREMSNDMSKEEKVHFSREDDEEEESSTYQLKRSNRP